MRRIEFLLAIDVPEDDVRTNSEVKELTEAVLSEEFDNVSILSVRQRT